MDILNLAQGMVNGSGLPMQAEPIAARKRWRPPRRRRRRLTTRC